MPFFPTNTLVNTALNDIKNNTPHLALFTSSPNANGGGTEVGGAYTRLPITFGAISSGSMSNSAAITFTNLPKATITHYAVMSAATGGTMKGYGALSSPAPAEVGDQITIPVGGIVINMTGS